MLKHGDIIECIDNSGNVTHGARIPLEIGEKVKFIHYFGCCVCVERSNGDTYTLNKDRFKKEEAI